MIARSKIKHLRLKNSRLSSIDQETQRLSTAIQTQRYENAELSENIIKHR